MGRKKERKRLTAEHFRIFKDEFRRIMGLLSLDDWHVEFKFENTSKYARGEDSVVHGLCDTDSVARSALIVLGKDVLTANDLKDEVLDTARHECMELLLSDMVAAAEARTWSDDQFESVKHSAICRLCNMLEKVDKNSSR